MAHSLNLACGCAPRTERKSPVAAQCQAQSDQVLSRRQALGLVAGAAALLSANSAEAAFGESAAIFKGKPTNTSGFIPYSGEGYALLLPSKWNPSREREAPGVALKYEDNGDSLNNVTIYVSRSSAGSIEQVGSPDAFLKDGVQKLLGEQVFKGETISEGGFAKNKVSSASLLDVSQAKDSKGKTYYKYEILTRAADGNEGGRHNLVTAAVGNGNLYICRVQIGDKRWFKGASKEGQGVVNSFVVA